ncbi:MAG: outer membrane protein assembly factor BamE [Verrucomicrobiota bacterium]|nr:outer membrane protein assembly factor BamE [Verrucomicrobiota bacterium]
MPWRHLPFLCCLGAGAIVFSGCHQGQRLRKANVDEVVPGMAKKQVESILGMPTTVDVKELDLTKRFTYVYTQGHDTVTLVFWDDKLESKESTLKD